MKSNKEILIFFADLIEKELGIIYSESNYFQLESRLEEMAKSLNFKDVKSLYLSSKEHLSKEIRELLVDVSTNNETSFFRDKKIFCAIDSYICQEIEKGKRSFSFWCAASSAGQEPLSLSIILNEIKEQKCEDIKFNIHATDISKRVLKKAQKAVYNNLEISRGLSETLKNKYCKSVEDGWAFTDLALKPIHYQLLNLKDNFDFTSNFDIIFCRNVLIYQSIKGKKIILKKMHDTLKHNGMLVLGSGESLVGLSDQFQQTTLKDCIVYLKK